MNRSHQPAIGLPPSLRRLVAAPQLKLVLATLLWGGNVLVGRTIHDDMTAIGLGFWRWALALAILLPLSWGEIRREWMLVRRAWPLFFALGAVGIAFYSISIYQALRETTAVHASLFLTLLPRASLLASRLIDGERIGRGRLLGICTALIGALVIVSRGRPAELLALRLESGDSWMLAALVAWGIYTVLQQRRPNRLSPLALATLSVGAAVLLILPWYVWELLHGVPTRLTLNSALSVLYAAAAASAAGHVLWIRGASALGAGRAAVYTNLMAVFAVVLAILFLGETIAAYHLAGAALTAAGIFLAGQQTPWASVARRHTAPEATPSARMSGSSR